MNKRSRPLAGLALVAAGAIGFGQTIPIEHYHLKNGLNVILAPDHRLPIATINTWFYVGSKDEPDHRSGFAHLFEHLMFMGTTRVPNGQFDKIMEAEGGSNNASTAEDRTNFFSEGPANLLPTLLWLDADRLEGLSKAMTQQKLDLQRQVVLNERRQNTENTPYGRAYEVINSLMFPVGHPYHNSVIGSPDDLNAAQVKDVVTFFNVNYVPNNASLVVAGDFDPKAIKAVIEKYYGSLPRQNDVIRRPVPPIGFDSTKKVTMVDQVQFPKIIDVYHAPAAFKPGDLELRLASSVLSDGLTSRLYQRLVVKDQTASDVSTQVDPKLLGSLFYVDATATSEAVMNKLQAAIDDEIAKFAKSGPTNDELARAKAKTQFGLLNSLQNIDEKADMLNQFQMYAGNPDVLGRVLARYQSATPEVVRDIVAKTLDPSRRLELRVIPQTEEPAKSPRDDKPEIPGEKPFSPVPPTGFKLANGIQVWYWNMSQLPMMAVSASFGAGADIDPASKSGAAAVMSQMLGQGAGNLDADAFQNALDLLGASFDASAGHMESRANLSVISSNFQPAMKLFADAVMHPKFDATEWDRVKRTTVADLQQELDSPQAVARLVGLREYFGASHPFGRPVSGSPESVQNLNLADLKSDYRTIVEPATTTLYVAGSLSQADVQKQLESTLGTWKSSAPPAPAVQYLPAADDLPVSPSKLRVVVVDKPGAVQSVIRFVLPGIGYDNPMRHDYQAISTILGGSFTSRLNQNLREAKGYTYGAGSFFDFEKPLGYFVASAAVRADVTGASLDEFLKEFKAIRGGDISEAEAKKAGALQRADIVQSLASLQGLIGEAIELKTKGHGFDSLADELKADGAVSAANLNALVAKAIDIDEGVLVIVGDKDLILKQIAGTGLPEPTIVKP